VRGAGGGGQPLDAHVVPPDEDAGTGGDDDDDDDGGDGGDDDDDDDDELKNHRRAADHPTMKLAACEASTKTISAAVSSSHPWAADPSALDLRQGNRRCSRNAPPWAKAPADARIED
jgi:hypothetical protein